MHSINLRSSVLCFTIFDSILSVLSLLCWTDYLHLLWKIKFFCIVLTSNPQNQPNHKYKTCIITEYTNSPKCFLKRLIVYSAALANKNERNREREKKKKKSMFKSKSKACWYHWTILIYITYQIKENVKKKKKKGMDRNNDIFKTKNNNLKA